MKRIKLNERQILMLKNLERGVSDKNKVLRISESQYNRLFNNKGNAAKDLSKSFNKAGIGENTTKEINLNEFAEEVIVFIKDILSNPRTMSFSSYWKSLGISKSQLFNMAKKQGLLTLTDENPEIKEYITPKFGFRKNVKELYKNISEKYTSLNELGDSGYPAGAWDDANAPWNEPDSNESQEEIIRLSDEEKKFKILYMESDDDLGIFKAGGELFVVALSHIGHINEDPEVFDGKYYVYDYEGDVNNITPLGFEDYVNDMYNQGKSKPVRNDNADEFPVPTLITPIIKKKILKWYGNDPKIAELLNQLPETTGAASSGAYVGGASFNGPIKKNTGKSPEEAMGALISDENIIDEGKWARIMKGVRSNPQGPFSVVVIIDNKVVDQANGIKIADAIPAYYEHMKRKHPNAKISIENGEGLSLYNEGLDETTTTTSVGGDSGTFAYDAPAGDGKDFWTAGNKMNKGKAEKTNGTPIVRGGAMVKESDINRTGFELEPKQQAFQNYAKIHTTGAASPEDWENRVKPMLDKEVEKAKNVKENVKVGQVYKKGLGRIKVMDIKKNPLKKTITVKQWGDGDKRQYEMDPKELGSWEILIENKNLNKTAYPNGEMVSFDDCTKLNNNKVAQNGGCSQGDTGVVKLSKTKGSVVAEDFKPNVAAGSTYAIEVKPMGAKIALRQDNGQAVVIHYDDVPNVINLLNKYYTSK
tara:strand:- start:4826 stop:6934 length:2109 start_codon:yes stop_codon:yes gene_type:complete